MLSFCVMLLGALSAVTEENIAGNTVAVGGATLFLAGEFCAHLSFFFLLTIEPYKL